MGKKQFKVSIKAEKNIVWHALWSDEFYRRWTSAFADGSYAGYSRDTCKNRT